nr:progonadoliberin-2 [Vicugna pacos]
MASFGPGLLLLLLLLITHPGPLKAQHWSHGWYPGGKRASSSPQDPQHAPRPPGKVLGTAAGSPGQNAHGLPSVPWEGKTMARWLLRRKQLLVQTLLTGPQAPRPATFQ